MHRLRAIHSICDGDTAALQCLGKGHVTVTTLVSLKNERKCSDFGKNLSSGQVPSRPGAAAEHLGASPPSDQ